MTTLQTPSRRIDLEGCANFRDLGGYETRDGRTVRWRRLFRSDALHQLTSADIAFLAQNEVDVATAFDLRTHQERERTGWGPWQQGRRFRHVPFVQAFLPDELTTSVGLCERMLQLFEKSSSCFGQMFSALADPATYPAVYFCTAGKDRTGMMSAVVLRVLGVPDEVIVEDFALTRALDLTELQAKLRAMGIEREINPSILEARPDTMQMFLSELDGRYRRVETFLAWAGVNEAQLEAVRSNLLEG